MKLKLPASEYRMGYMIVTLDRKTDRYNLYFSNQGIETSANDELCVITDDDFPSYLGISFEDLSEIMFKRFNKKPLCSD